MDSNNRITLLQALIYPVLLIILGVAVYFNSFNGVFVFDDDTYIKDALEIRTLFPPWEAMFSGLHHPRPVAGLTFAINYAISELNIWSYHIFNLAIHMVSGLALFGTLRLALNKTSFRNISAILSLVVCLIWLVHPLHTEAVTYIIQRYESLMGMFFLLSLFCYARSTESTKNGFYWKIASVLFCYLGVGSKQVAAVIPIVVLLYDRTFVTASFKTTFRKQWRFLMALFFSWILLLALHLTAEPFEWAGFDMEVVTPFKFTISEFGVIVHYIRLTFWPDPLVFDYFWQLAEKPGEIVPYALIIVFLLSLSLWGLIKNHPFGFLGCSFFLLLSPTSSIMPLSDLAADHRMYLPSIPIIIIAVISFHALFQRLPALVGNPENHPKIDPIGTFSSKPGTITFGFFALFIIIIFSTLTIERNELYSSGTAIWQDTVEKAPHNPRAWANLGNALIEEQRYDEALISLEKALELKPNYSIVLINLGFLHSLKNEAAKAAYYWEKALESRPHYRTYYNLGLLYHLQGNKKKAIKNFEEAVSLKPRWTPALIRLAWLYATDNYSSQDKRKKAVIMAEDASRSVKMANPFYLDTLAAAYAANLQFDKAIQIQMQAINLIKNQNNNAKVQQVMLFRYNLYQNRRPFTLLPNQLDPTIGIPR
ncbi:tetratricopeptide repeat protein [bacterium]|nr:tetratricopeptide repeat protein [bacterium]